MSTGNLRILGRRPELLVDSYSRIIVDPDGNQIGFTPLKMLRVVYALPQEVGVGRLSLRYTPNHADADSMIYGMDFSKILPGYVGIADASLKIQTNTPGNVLDTEDFTISEVLIEGRTVYATLSGGDEGQDYRLHWVITDTLGQTLSRTGLLLVGPTS